MGVGRNVPSSNEKTSLGEGESAGLEGTEASIHRMHFENLILTPATQGVGKAEYTKKLSLSAKSEGNLCFSDPAKPISKASTGAWQDQPGQATVVIRMQLPKKAVIFSRL